MLKLWSRASALRNVLSSHADNPYLRGRAAQIAGGALLADGLFGLENPLDGKKSRGGIGSSFVGMMVGVVFVFVVGGMSEGLKPYDNGLLVTGTVSAVEVQTTRDSEGKATTSCGATVTYSVDGTQYSVQSPVSSQMLCSKRGTQVQVSYEPSAPAAGRPLFAELGKMMGLFKGVGWLVLVLSAVTFLVRLVEIVAGVRLLLWGRKQVGTSSPEQNEQLMAQLRQAWTGQANDPAPVGAQPAGLPFGIGGAGPVGGVGGVLGGLAGQLLTQATQTQPGSQPGSQPGPAAAPSHVPASPHVPAPPVPAAPQPATTAGPPPGWFPDPAGGDSSRWWDGTAWTEHVRPGHPPQA